MRKLKRKLRFIRPVIHSGRHWRSRIKRLDIIIFSLLILVVSINFAFFYVNTIDEPVRADVIQVIDTRNDGGLIYQNLEVRSQGEIYKITQEVPDNRDLQYKAGDSIILEQKGENFKIVGFDQTEYLLISLVILFLLLLISIGLDDFKEILPVLLFLPFFMSGLLFEILDKAGVYLTILLLLPAVTLITVTAVSRRMRIALATTLATLLTLLAILPLSLITYEIFNLAKGFENFNYLGPVFRMEEYQGLYHFSVLIIIFGTIINSSIATSTRAVAILKRQAQSKELIRKIIVDSQKDIARRINSLFFILLGFSIIAVSYAYETREDFWNEQIFIQNFTYFIISGLSVILSVFFSAGLVTYFVRSDNQEKR